MHLNAIKQFIIEGEFCDHISKSTGNSGLKINGRLLANSVERVFGSQDMRQCGDLVGHHYGRVRITIERLGKSD